MTNKQSLYLDLKKAEIELDHYCSDLHVKDSPKARKIIISHGKKIDGWIVQPFISNTDNTVWLDIPFNYDPYWEGKENERLQRKGEGHHEDDQFI